MEMFLLSFPELVDLQDTIEEKTIAKIIIKRDFMVYFFYLFHYPPGNTKIKH